jgi:hypothetical protein
MQAPVGFPANAPLTLATLIRPGGAHRDLDGDHARDWYRPWQAVAIEATRSMSSTASSFGGVQPHVRGRPRLVEQL